MAPQFGVLHVLWRTCYIPQPFWKRRRHDGRVDFSLFLQWKVSCLFPWDFVRLNSSFTLRIAGDDLMVIDPNQLLGKRLDLVINIKQCHHLKWIEQKSTRGIMLRLEFVVLFILGPHLVDVNSVVAVYRKCIPQYQVTYFDELHWTYSTTSAVN